MGSVVDNPRTKTKCQIFTPDDIVSDMLDYVGYTTDMYGKKVLENSCGDGQFLKEIVRRYILDCKQRNFSRTRIKNGLQRDIFGIELDSNQYRKCIENLDAITDAFNIKRVSWQIKNADALRAPFTCAFDYVVGNPPYVSYWDLDAEEREFILSHYSACTKGASDYSYAFFQEGFSRLSPTGKMAYIVPNSILKTNSAQILRDIIKDDVSKIYDYTNQDVFKQVLTAPVVIVIEKGMHSTDLKYINVSNQTSLLIDKETLINEWIFKAAPLHLSEKQHRFGNYFNVATSVATQLNQAFILQETTLETNSAEKAIEHAVIRKAASPKNKQRHHNEFIIFPYYYDDSNHLCRYSEAEFSEKFPNAYSHLKGYKTCLEKRDADKSALWFEYGRSQALKHLNKEKLLVSTVITEKVKVFTLDADEIPYSGLYITVREGSQLTLADAKKILTSAAFFEYLKPLGVVANGKSFRIVAKNICNYTW